SLVGQVLWGVALGLFYCSLRRNAKNAVVIGACVVSHWFLDVIAHRPTCLCFLKDRLLASDCGIPCQPPWPSSAVCWPLVSRFICARPGRKIVSESTGCGPSWSC